MSYHVKNKEDFDAKLAEAGSRLVVVDFYATWCGPCKHIAPQIEKMAGEKPNVMFLKVDVDECEELSGQFNIQAMPTFIFLKNKEKVGELTGANFEKLTALVAQHQ